MGRPDLAQHFPAAAFAAFGLQAALRLDLRHPPTGNPAGSDVRKMEVQQLPRWASCTGGRPHWRQFLPGDEPSRQQSEAAPSTTSAALFFTDALVRLRGLLFQ